MKEKMMGQRSRKELLKEMIKFLEPFERWFSRVAVKEEDKEGKENLLRQTREALRKWKKELAECP